MPQPSRHAIRRVAIYARYSSDNQREASIDDQIRLCRALATREGWEVVEIFQDAAMSGSTAFRPGYQALLAAAKRGQFEVVMAEALDRLSRDQSDTASLHKNLQFAGISLYTCAEGEVNELHVGLKGTMNALYIKDLAQKTHRGQRGRVEAGKSGGGLCYGYDAVRSLDARGEPIRGERRINPEQAPVVQRIFRLFNEGHSPIEIARLLNREAVPGPGGREWRDTTIRGHAARGTGILRNELYIGRLVWNRMRYLKDPSTGRRISRMNGAGERVVSEVPELRIIEDTAWQQTQQRLACRPRAQRRRQTRPHPLLGAAPRGDPAHQQTFLWLLRRAVGTDRQGLSRLQPRPADAQLRQPAQPARRPHRRADPRCPARPTDAAGDGGGLHLRLLGPLAGMPGGTDGEPNPDPARTREEPA